VQITDSTKSPYLGYSAGQLVTLWDGTNSFFAQGGTVFRYDASGQQFIFNWNTKGFTLAGYTLTATLADGQKINATLNLTTNGGNASLVIDGATGTSNGAGALLVGDETLYIDNSSGYFTDDALARIQDAVNSIESLISGYGANITIVDSSVGLGANFVIDASSTSAVGGFADGVLGCYNDAAGKITLIQGWNWYGGSDASGIGSSQYDFQTVITHEIGHALGLGHSTDSNSVMYADLSSGAVRRTLVKADLNVADDSAAPDGLHAAGANVADNGGGQDRNVATPPSNPNQYLMFAGALQAPLAGNVSRAVAAPAMAPSGLAPTATYVAANFDFGSLMNSFSSRATSDALRNSGGDGLGDRLVEEVGRPVELGPDSNGSSQDDQPVLPDVFNLFESITAPTAVGAARPGEETSWLVGSLETPAANSESIMTQGPSADAWILPGGDDYVELAFVAAGFAGIPGLVGESEQKSAALPKRGRTR
jgi:hypothetical protein